MNESIKRVIIGIVIIVVLIFVGIVIFKKKDPKLFKSRMDELDDCHDICFEKYPFQWQVEKRQSCLTSCLSNDKMSKKTKDWIDEFNNINDNLKSRMWNNPKECTTDCLNTNPGFTEYNCRKTCGDYNVFCFNECVGDKYPGKDKTEMCYKQGL